MPIFTNIKILTSLQKNGTGRNVQINLGVWRRKEKEGALILEGNEDIRKAGDIGPQKASTTWKGQEPSETSGGCDH